MPSRRRIEHRTSGAAGGVSPIIAVVEWGPDFGESSDNNTFTVGAHVDMPQIELVGNLNCGCNVAFTNLSVDYTGPTVGAHLSGEVLAAPFWQSVETDTATATPITVNKPASVAAGDLLIALIGITVTGPAATPSVTTPAGWTSIRATTVNGAANTTHGNSFYRIADGTEGANFSFTFAAGGGTVSRVTGEIHRLIAADTTTPINVSADATLLGSALNPDPVSPSVTTTSINCLVFAWLVHDHLALSQTHTEPASHTETTDFQATNTGNIVSSTTDWRVFASAGATGTATHNCTETASTDAIMQRIAITPGTLIIAP